MKSPLRTVGAIVTGVIAAYVIVVLAELLTSRMYPMPADLDMGDAAAMKVWIQQLPAVAFALVLCGWAGGAFLGGLVAARIEPDAWLRDAIIIGVLLLAASVANMVSIPHPAWMWIGACLLLVPASYLGGRVGAGTSSTAAAHTLSRA